jgi:hypothetical protein
LRLVGCRADQRARQHPWGLGGTDQFASLAEGGEARWEAGDQTLVSTKRLTGAAERIADLRATWED